MRFEDFPDRCWIGLILPAVKYKELRTPSSSEDSAAVRSRVIAARQSQTERFLMKKMTYCNAQMVPKETLCDQRRWGEVAGKRGDAAGLIGPSS